MKKILKRPRKTTKTRDVYVLVVPVTYDDPRDNEIGGRNDYAYGM